MGKMISPKLRQLSDEADEDGQMYAHECPGCGTRHYIPVGNPDGPTWSFNNNGEKPTFHPSVNIGNGQCHYFIQEGKILFTNDCKHALAGLTVDLPELKGY